MQHSSAYQWAQKVLADDSCGAMRLSEHCRASGGYALASCVVARQGSTLHHEFERPLKEQQHGLEEGDLVSRHHGCVPSSRLSVPRFLAGCAAGAAAALLVVRLRARQLRRLGF
ncbi:hypothetical protein ABPG75_012672 [Micractinium tetrahymenae]